MTEEAKNEQPTVPFYTPGPNAIDITLERMEGF